MKTHAIAWLILLTALAGAAPLYTTQGIKASGFSDNDPCSVNIIDQTNNIIETHTIQNDCINKDIAYLDQDCYIYSVNGTVTYTVFLGEKYTPAAYTIEVRCGNALNATTSFTATAPNLQLIDFNQYPQLLSTAKLTARTQTEKTTRCTARIMNTQDMTTTSLVTDIPLTENGIFAFNYFIAAEAAYQNYTLNLTCDDYSTLQFTFKPTLIDLSSFAVMGVGLSFELILILSAVLVIVIFLFAALFMKDTIQELIARWNL